MAKNTKSTRARRSKMDTGNPRSYSELLKTERESAAPVKSAANPTAAKPAATAPVVSSSVDTINWGTEYAQVFADLRQLLIISVALILLMIVLGLVV